MRRFISAAFVLAFAVACGGEKASDDNSANKSDKDISGYIRDTDGQPFVGVVVSDGFSCTVTDSKGFYEMNRSNTNAQFVIYSLPADGAVSFGSNGRPEYWQSIFPKKTSYDFTIPRQPKESKFTLISIGDPQVSEENKGLERFAAETAPDVRAFAASYPDRSCYAFTMGDHVHNRWNLFEDIFALLDKSHLGVASFPVIGNHDHEQKKDSEWAAMQTYQSVAGPVNYSLNRSDCHIVVLDDLVKTGNTDSFDEGISEETITWLKQDLKYVSTDKRIIVCMHALMSRSSAPELYEALARFPKLSVICGHSHSVRNNIYDIDGKEVIIHVTGTSNGVDWAGTICGDGAPMGYGVFEVEGSEIKNQFYKGVNLPKDYQIRMYHSSSFPAFSHYVSNASPAGEVSFDWDRTENSVIINIWNYNRKWKVEAYEDGVKSSSPVTLDNSMYDMWACTYFYKVCDRQTTTYCQRRNHLFKFCPENPSAQITIKATDEYGNVYTQSEFTVTTESALRYQ